MFCGKCGQKNPDDYLFCAACGFTLLGVHEKQTPSMELAQATVASAVDPALTLPPTVTATCTEYFHSKAAHDPLNGVRGWLLFFCVMLTIITPIFYIFLVLRLHSSIDILLHSTLIALSVYAGIMVWRVRPSALQWVTIYLVASVAFVLGNLILAMQTGVMATVEQSQDQILGSVRGLIGPIIWAFYFKKSRRVRATYGRNL